MTCDCINHYYRAGRAQYLCTRCERDVTIDIVLMAEAGIPIPPIIPTEFKPFKPTGKQLLTDIYKRKTKEEIENELSRFNNPILSKQIVAILHEKGIYEGYITE